MSLYNLTALSRRGFLKGIGISGVAMITGEAKATDIDNKPSMQTPVDAVQDVCVLSTKQGVVISIGAGIGSLGKIVAERLADHIYRVTGVKSPIYSSADLNGTAETVADKAVIRLSRSPILRFRSDGYRISTERQHGKVAICLCAPDEVGLKYAGYRLIREMKQNGSELHVPALSVEANPWIKTRELFIGDLDLREPTPGEKTQFRDLLMKFDWQNWDISRLQRYVDQVDAMGYNSVMLTDPRTLFGFTPESPARSLDSITNKVEAMYQRARRNGMSTAFFLWGQEGVGPVAADYLVARNDPWVPKQADEIHTHWRELIGRFGPLVDRWVLHWADPGGCKADGCTINTPQVMTNEFLNLVRRMGFSSDVSFSLWGLRWGNGPESHPWPGYVDWTSVTNSGTLSPEVGIAMMRHYEYSQAKAITTQYRKAGVWGWYLNDIETNPSLHVHNHILEREFRRIDSSASELLDWYSVEDNNHCLNIPSVYIGAQMLWDPKASASQSIEDFCRATWGANASSIIARALAAIGQVRCGPGQYIPDENLWPNDYMCWFGKGSASPQDDVAMCEGALHDLDSVTVQPGHVPQQPLVLEPKELLGYIRSHLSYVLQFARIRLAYKEALQPALEGRFEETQSKMLSLPVLPDVIEGVYGARQELTYYKLIRKSAALWQGRSFADNLALGKNVTASSWFNNDPRFSPKNAVNGILCEFEEEGWAAGAPGPAWLKIDLGRVEMIQSVRIYNRAYHRGLLKDNLIATPSKAEIFLGESDRSPSSGNTGEEPGYRLIGGFESWLPTEDPGAYREIKAKVPVSARFIKVVIYAAANGQPVGCGEVEARKR